MISSTFNFNWFLDNCLPFINKLQNKVIVIKYGGAAMKKQGLKVQVMQDIIFLSTLGIKLVLVHGGGPMINDWLTRVNIEPKFQNGIRVTDEHTMEIVEMILVGKVNKDLVNLLNINQNIAVGLSGKDANLLIASPLVKHSNNLVGKIDLVNVEFLQLLLDSHYIPVVASVASSKDLTTYNVNADTVASSIATALNAEKLIVITDTPGVLLDLQDSNSLQKTLSISDVEDLCNQHIIFEGMIPKVECCVNAVKNNVKTAHIIDGRVEHSLLFELLTEDRVGSQIIL